jgi:hypothetical protein
VQPFFLWLEDTALSLWIRETPSVFAFPTILTAHAIGMGFAVGVNAAMALRLLGVAPGVPPRELKRFVPFMWFGFWLNTISGVLLLIAYPTKALTNPVFYLKIALIATGMWLYAKMSRLMFGNETPVGKPWLTGRQLAIASLTCWAAATTAGRLLAYTATRILASHY